MLHGSETWPVRKENVVALQRAEMRMVRWMCGVKLKDRLPSKELSVCVCVCVSFCLAQKLGTFFMDHPVFAIFEANLRC